MISRAKRLVLILLCLIQKIPRGPCPFICPRAAGLTTIPVSKSRAAGSGSTRRVFLKGTGILAGLLATGQYPVKAGAKRPLLLAHYMPWYQTPEISGYWGWHWTMDHFDPSQENAQGQPAIASHYHPLTGPYDSSDDALLEYQALLMKISGIDGVIVDWYGTEDFWDYAVLNRATGKLFEHIAPAGLTFAICYEDQTVLHMVEEGHITRDEAHTIGQNDLRYLHDQWFSSDAYLTVAGQPVLFTFGPQYFKSAADWEALFSVVEPSPALITLDGHLVAGQLASYPWPPMIGIDSNLAAVEAYLTQFYHKARWWEYKVGGAFPGFHDIYAEAGVRSSYGYLDAQNGEIFRATLQMALKQDLDVIQLITWNDYGEGTIIEPTSEFGYQYLEALQTTRKALEPGFAFTPGDLRLPLQLFELRKAAVGDAEQNARLDTAAAALRQGDLVTARAIITGETE